MEKEKVVHILKCIQSLLYNNMEYEAKEYIKLEIENLEGITPKKCKNSIFKFYFCKECNNFNCPDNKNEKDKI